MGGNSTSSASSIATRSWILLRTFSGSWSSSGGGAVGPLLRRFFSLKRKGTQINEHIGQRSSACQLLRVLWSVTTKRSYRLNTTLRISTGSLKPSTTLRGERTPAKIDSCSTALLPVQAVTSLQNLIIVEATDLPEENRDKAEKAALIQVAAGKKPTAGEITIIFLCSFFSLPQFTKTNSLS